MCQELPWPDIHQVQKVNSCWGRKFLRKFSNWFLTADVCWTLAVASPWKDIKRTRLCTLSFLCCLGFLVPWIYLIINSCSLHLTPNSFMLHQKIPPWANADQVHKVWGCAVGRILLQISEQCFKADIPWMILVTRPWKDILIARSDPLASNASESCVGGVLFSRAR